MKPTRFGSLNPRHASDLANREFMASRLNMGTEEIWPDFEARYARIVDSIRVCGEDMRDRMPQMDQEGLDRCKALVRGLHVKRTVMPPWRLFPLQKDIYFDKCVNGVVEKGLIMTQDLLAHGEPIYIASHGHIIDGHHRWASAYLFDRQFPMPCLMLEHRAEDIINQLGAYHHV